ncbi:MAG: methyltransferase domain-containing protein [Bacteroidales bacterium]|nr:methyltransferase domain-containing protein [Bacteroidales bacterium]
MILKSIYKKIVSEKVRINVNYFYFKIRALYYIGNTCYCVCCKKSFRKFLDYGNNPRKNAACPYCNSLERTRLLQFYLEKETTIFAAGKKVLHFAPERMLERKFKKSGCLYISADINPALADMVVDITAIPFPDNYFDFIICSHVLGHVYDEGKAIDEMYRVLKTGGRALVLTVINQNSNKTLEDNNIQTATDRLKYYGEADLVRLHGNDFEFRLMRPKIEVRKIDYRGSFSAADKIRFSLGDSNRELIFDCIKL